MDKSLVKGFQDLLTFEENEENMCPNVSALTVSSVTEDSVEEFEPEPETPTEHQASAVSSSEVILPPGNHPLIDNRYLRVRHGIGMVMLNNIHYGLTATSLITTFKKFGQMIYYMVRYVETCSGIRGIAGVIFKNKMDAATAVRELSPFFEDGEINLITAHSSIKSQEYAVKVMAICSCFDDYEFVPLNTFPPQEVNEAIQDFMKLLDLGTG